MNQDELRRKHADVQQQYEELREKIAELQQAYAVATANTERATLKQQIATAEAAHAQMAQELAAIAQQLHPDDAPPGITAPTSVDTDTEIEVETLIELQQGGEPIFPPEPAEGKMRPNSPFYVERSGDRTVITAIRKPGQGVTITIKGPPQVGKSALLDRAIAAAHEAGKRIALINLQQFNTAAHADAATFLRAFCRRITDATGLHVPDDRLDAAWSEPLDATRRCTHYLQQHLLAGLMQPLVLALDEVDSLRTRPFCGDFLGMLRHWHTCRATEQAWRQLDLLLVTSVEPDQLVADRSQSPFVEPDQLVADRSQSPFDVSTLIELGDFTPEQVSLLNRRHGMPFTVVEERQLTALLNGHPYLTRRALYLVSAREQHFSPADIFVDAPNEVGPFGAYLRAQLQRLHAEPDLVAGMRQVLENQSCNEQLFLRLRSAGLVRRAGKAVLPRCQLYANYFREQL
jgi:hypothetical protein